MKTLPAIFPILALLGAAACVSTPDADELRDIRAASAADRVAALESRTPFEGRADFLEGPLSLADALSRALAMNLSLKQETLERDIASGRIQASWQNALPRLSASAAYTRLDDDLSTVADDGTVTRGRFLDQSSASLTLTQPLFSARLGAAVRAARLYREWAEASIRGAEETVRYNVVRAYYQARLSAHLLEVKEKALETATRQSTETSARRRQGMASHYDTLRATVEVSNCKAQVLQARESLDLANTTLFRLIGASPDSRVDLVDPLPFVPETIAFDDAVRAALANRADLAVADLAARMQRESVANARADYYPDLSAYAKTTLASPDPHDSRSDDWGDEWQAGLQASWTLFDGLARRGALAQERAKLAQLELALQDAEETVVSEIRQLVLTLATTEEFALSQSQNLETAQEALRLVEVGLREGQNTQVEVMDARQALTTASANYYQSIYDHAMARLSLLRAMGSLRDAPAPSQPILSSSPEPSP
ncbi:MAG: TolC family protein [Kiritimatiellae bacterium]|nr:TolC family protein [Kiritimatiellia bacterium]